MTTSKEIAETSAKLLSDKKASDIILLSIEHLTVIADYFVIASAKSTTQVKALGEHVEEKFSEMGLEPVRREGFSDGRWIVLDYGDVVVHIFHDEMRMFYCLERLWEDGNNLIRYEG